MAPCGGRALKCLAPRAVFLDTHGTLLEHVPHELHPARIRLLASVMSGLRILAARGYALVVVGNEPDVARGFIDPALVDAVAERLGELLAPAGLELRGFYWCPHLPPSEALRDGHEGCDCAMPAPGLLLRAAEEHGLDLVRSWIIGDVLDDVEAGHRAACRAVLIDNGQERDWQWSPLRTPEFVARNFLAAARYIDRAAEHAPKALYRRHAELGHA